MQATLEPEFQVIAGATGQETLPRLVERHRPDVLIFDPEPICRAASAAETKLNGSMRPVEIPAAPGMREHHHRMTGMLPCVERLVGQADRTRLLAYSHMRDENGVTGLLAGGVKGYVLRSDPPVLLSMAIRAVAAEQTFLTPSLSHIVEHALLKPQLGAPTTREGQILEFLAQGKTNKHIANLLNLSVRTVEAHRMSLMRKLGAHSAAELIRIAIRRGLIEP